MTSPSPETMPRFRWVVLFGVWLMYFSFGLVITSTGPLVSEIVADLAISHAAMGAILGAWQLVYIGSALPLGALLDRIGVALGLTLSAGIMALSCFLRGAAPDDVTLFLAVALFGLGGPIISIGAPKLIALWFEGKDRGMAMGLYITGPGIGGICALSLTNSVLMPVTGHDWRQVMWLYGAFVLLAGGAWWLLSRHPLARERDGKAGKMSKASSLTAFREILGIRTVQIVLLMSIGIFFFNHGLNNWLPEILRSRGMTPVEAGYWASVPTLVGILGAITIPRLATPERRVPIMFALFISAAIASVLLQLAPGIGLAAGLALQGIARSSMMTVAILLLMEAPGVPPERAGMAGGMFFTVAEIGGVLGPLSIGVLSHATGGFAVPLSLLSVICVLLLGLLAMLRLGEMALAGRTPNR